MDGQRFVLSRTLRPVEFPRHLADDARFRGELIERFAEIHERVVCEHQPGEAYLLADAVLNLKVRGSVVECGCFQGGMTAKLSLACAATRRTLYVCDSFSGLPKPELFGGEYRHDPDRSDVLEKFGATRLFQQGEYAASLNTVQANIEAFGCIDVCRFVPGCFSDTLPNLDINPALVSIDVDLIESGRECLKWLWPRLSGRRFFTHEAFNRTYMDGLLDSDFWQVTFGEPVPEVAGDGTGLNRFANCTAVLLKPSDGGRAA